MLATRDEKGRIVLTLESDAEATELWHKLNVPAKDFGKWYVKKYGDDGYFVSSYNEHFDGWSMWTALDDIMHDNEEKD